MNRIALALAAITLFAASYATAGDVVVSGNGSIVVSKGGSTIAVSGNGNIVVKKPKKTIAVTKKNIVISEDDDEPCPPKPSCTCKKPCPQPCEPVCQPVCQPRCYTPNVVYYVPAPVLVERVPCVRLTTLCVRCWAPCGGYFIDTVGRKWALPEGVYMPAQYRTGKVQGYLDYGPNGLLNFTVTLPCGRELTFVDP